MFLQRPYIIHTHGGEGGILDSEDSGLSLIPTLNGEQNIFLCLGFLRHEMFASQLQLVCTHHQNL
jgi:hypothetical protein